MRETWIHFCCLTLGMGGGFLSPARSFSADYRFLATFYEESRAAFFSMDGSGQIAEQDSYEVGIDAERVAASPNGQLVVATSGIHPQISAFFINRHGSIDPPRGYDPLESTGYDPPFTFHAHKNVAFAAFRLTSTVLQIDYHAKELYSTSCTLTLSGFESYSPWSNHVYYRKFLVPQGIAGIGLSSDDCFTTTAPILPLAFGQMSRGFAVSPDGKWAVALGIQNPKLSFASIQRDGSLRLHQQFSYSSVTEVSNPEEVRFTLDGKYLVMLDEGPYDLISFRLNADANLWEQVDHTTAPHDPRWWIPHAMAISPDGKFIVVHEISPSGGWTLTTFRVVRLGEDGSLTILPDKYLEVYGYPSALEFIPPWRESYPGPTGVMAH